MDSLKIRAGDINPTFNNGLNNQTEDQQERTSLVIQGLGLSASTARGLGSIPGQGTMISQAMRCSQKLKKKNTSNQ